MNACPTCPNRLHADTLEALAEVASISHADTLEALAEAASGSRWFRLFAPVLRRRAQEIRTTGYNVLKQRAEEIRKAGCNNWKLLREDLKDPNTGHVVETQEVARCMRDRMVAYLNDIHLHAALTGKAAESHRNIVAEGFSFLAGTPIRGDGKTLPEGWRKVIGIGEGNPSKTAAAIGDGQDNAGGDG